jgi:ATP-dependent RNA helicase HelY
MYREYPVQLIITQLNRNDLLPCILFRSSRRQCNEDIQTVESKYRSILTPIDKLNIREAVDEIIQKYQMSYEVIYDHEHLNVLLEHGIGAHHAGQLLMWRLLLEELMTRGVLKMLIATGTVAAGVDFPARSVVVTAHSRRDSNGFRILTSSEFQQMSGRAGRRGKDSVGFCLIAPTIYSDARIFNRLIDLPPEPLTSAYFASPSTVLNLLKYRNVDDLQYTVERSLASFFDHKKAKKIGEELESLTVKIDDSETTEDAPTQTAAKKISKKLRRLQRDIESLKNNQLNILKQSLVGLEKLGYLNNGSLTAKGEWSAALCTNVILELAEAIETKLFDDIDYRTLAALVASISGDPHRIYISNADNPISKKYFEGLREIVNLVEVNYQSPLKQEIKVLPTAALTVLAWLDAKSWTDFSSLLRLLGVTQGDVARLVNQTTENLNQLTHLSSSHPLIATIAAEARMKLMRPPLTD